MALTLSGSALGLGKVLQVVQGSAAAQVDVTTTTYMSSGLTATITPTSTSSRILIFVSSSCAVSAANVTLDSSVFRGTASGTRIGTAVTLIAQTAGLTSVPLSILVLDSPATTSAQTYTLCAKTSGATGYINSYQSSGTSQMILVEVAP